MVKVSKKWFYKAIDCKEKELNHSALSVCEGVFDKKSWSRRFVILI
jgi:hypothetical protein